MWTGECVPLYSSSFICYSIMPPFFMETTSLLEVERLRCCEGLATSSFFLPPSDASRLSWPRVCCLPFENKDFLSVCTISPPPPEEGDWAEGVVGDLAAYGVPVCCCCLLLSILIIPQKFNIVCK